MVSYLEFLNVTPYTLLFTPNFDMPCPSQTPWFYHPNNTWWKLQVRKAYKKTVVKIKLYIMICYVTLCYVMLCYVMLCYVMLCYVMLCYVMLCYVMSCHVMSCHVMSCHVMPCHVISYHIISYHIISYHISYHIISYHIILYYIHALFYLCRMCTSNGEAINARYEISKSYHFCC